jgi:hypothetical protein
MAKTKICPYLRRSGAVATCGAYTDLDAIENPSKAECPKSRSQFNITQVCWKVPVKVGP